jgi:hypothetical protein
MRSLPPHLLTYRHETLFHIFISVLTCYSSYTASSNTKLPRTAEIKHYNDHETQKIAYFLTHSLDFSPSLTYPKKQRNCRTYFGHILLQFNAGFLVPTTQNLE